MNTYGTMTDFEYAYHIGWKDRACGLRLEMALNSPNAEYVRGYRAGQVAYEHGEPLESVRES